MGLATDDKGKVTGIKFGDGSTPWKDLAYFSNSSVAILG
jgi:hypothetical protein